jgi:hypothetical protein
MIIEKIDPSRKCFSDYFLDGNILTIGGVEIDLAVEEGDQEAILSFGSCDGVARRGLTPGCSYIADVVIPPRKWATITRPIPENDGDMDTEQQTEVETVAAPLDLETVTLRLWPVVDEAVSATENMTNMEGENNGA